MTQPIRQKPAMHHIRESRDAILARQRRQDWMLAQLSKAELEELAAVLLALVEDWHAVSDRPCPTCDPLSTVLGQPVGCTLHRRTMNELRARGR